jgi:hypothetical protein
LTITDANSRVGWNIGTYVQSLTLYVQNKSPGKDKEANWLPALDSPIYMVMRLYWPKEDALNGTWKPAPIVRVQ